MKTKSFIWIVVMLSLVLTVTAIEQNLGIFKQNTCIDLIQICQNCTYNNITSVNYPNSTLILGNTPMVKTNTEYKYNFCSTKALGTYLVYGIGDLDGIPTSWGYTFKITKFGIQSEDTNSSLPLILFMLFIIIGLFILGFVGKFNKNEIINLVLQRGCIVAAIMISMYTATLLLNIMTYANMDILGNEMIFLMTWIGWVGYVASVYLVIQTLFDILRLKKERRSRRINEVYNG